MVPRSLWLLIVGGLLLVVGILLVVPRIRAPQLTERITAEALHASLLREADTTFVVTGYLDLMATVRSQDQRVFLPDLLNLPLGTTRATVRVPGRVSYGFDIDALEVAMIRVGGDTIEIRVPPAVIYSAEPELERLEVETTTGWLRHRVTAQEAERRAVQLVGEALRRQGAAHLESSVQPRLNNARALRRLVEPVALGLGMERPYLRMELGDGLVLENEVRTN
jgi:hypothetical protein